MNNLCEFGKRNLPKRNVSKNIYTFYVDLEAVQQLKLISNKLCTTHSIWVIKCYPAYPNITYSEICNRIITPYHRYNYRLDKLCIIDKTNSIFIENTKIPIVYFSNVSRFGVWLDNLQTA